MKVGLGRKTFVGITIPASCQKVLFVRKVGLGHETFIGI